MKAISLLQPWAALLARGCKRIETRSWSTRYRGPVLIHVSGRFPEELQRLCGTDPFVNALFNAMGHDLNFVAALKRECGHIIGQAELFDCVPVESLWTESHSTMPAFLAEEPERSFGDYSAGRFGWLMKNPIVFKKPIRCRGALSLWTPPAEVMQQVQCELEAAA